MHARRRIVLVGVGVGLVVPTAGCFEDDGSRRFRNDTDATVWVAQNFLGDEGFDVGLEGWTEVPANDEAVYSTGGCVETGELIVATSPDERSIVDRRVFSRANPDAEEPLCSDWTWSGVGDHD